MNKENYEKRYPLNHWYKNKNNDDYLKDVFLVNRDDERCYFRRRFNGNILFSIKKYGWGRFYKLKE